MKGGLSKHMAWQGFKKDHSKVVWHSLTKKGVSETLETEFKRGLTDMFAGYRLQDYGENRVSSVKKNSEMGMFLSKLLSPVSLILIMIAVVSAVVNLTDEASGGYGETTAYHLAYSAALLVSALVLAGVRAKRELSTNRNILNMEKIASTYVKVRRNMVEKSVPAYTVVPGDVVLLEVGDIVPADGRLMESVALTCDESALSGKDTPVVKDDEAVLSEDTPLEQRVNMVYSGSVVMKGSGVMMVTKTGAETEAALRSNAKAHKVNNRTALVRNSYRLCAKTIWLVMGVSLLAMAATAWTAMHTNGSFFPHTWEEVSVMLSANFRAVPSYFVTREASIPYRPLFTLLLFIVTLTVCAIPLGLPQNVMYLISEGIKRIGKDGAVIRKFAKAETLCRTSIICADKTGTLTQNDMSVRKAWPIGDSVAVVEEGFWSEEMKYLMKCSAMCCDSRLTRGRTVGENLSGDHTEAAILSAYIDNGYSVEALFEKYARCAEIPFDSERRLMTVIYKVDGLYTVITKGAPDILAAKCADVDWKELERHNSEFCGEGLRVIAVAVHTLYQLPEEITPETIEKEMTFIGLLGLEDPYREEVKDAVKVCSEAGIRTVVLTGDHPETAASVAQQLGIMGEKDLSITGDEIAKMSDKQLSRSISRYTVFARVMPEDKVRLIRTWQSQGHCVLMTAGGMGDAPALHAADISCSVEATATDVAVEAADVTLAENNFVNILSLVKSGRRLRRNITKLTEYGLACSFGEALLLLAGQLVLQESLLNLLPITILNLLLFWLLQPSFADEPAERDIMDMMPEKDAKKIFSFFERWRVVIGGVYLTLNGLTAYAFGSGQWHVNEQFGCQEGVTMAFGAMGFGMVLHALCTRSEQPLLSSALLKNKRLLGSLFIITAVIALMISVPYVNTVLGLVSLNARQWCELAALAAVQLVVWEYPKLYRKWK